MEKVKSNTDVSYADFEQSFHYKGKNAWFMGVETEAFITDRNGNIVPRAKDLLKILNNNSRFSKELPAPQIESKVGPTKIESLINELMINEELLQAGLSKLGLKKINADVAPGEVPLIVYPDERYYDIFEKWTPKQREAAFSICGTHVQVGMPSLNIALIVYNYVIRYYKELCDLGDNSNGERHRMYEIVVPNAKPIPFNNSHDFYEYALKHGFANDPRRNWMKIRPNPVGTIEFRMFGSTPDFKKILSWVEFCYKICEEALER